METTANEYNELLTAKSTHTDLLKKRSAVQNKEETSQESLTNLRSQLDESEKQHAKLEKLFIRDEASSAELTNSRTKLDGLRQQLSEAERFAELASTAITEIDAEIIAASREIQSLNQKYCAKQHNLLAADLSNDKKINQKLIEAFAALMAARNMHDPDWPTFIRQTFPQPNQDDINAAISDFRAKHKLEGK